MNISEKRIKIARTKSGTPCLWESYTEFDDLKRAIIIIDNNGNIKNSIFIRQYGSKQSLIPITEGDYIVKIFNDKNGSSISILEIKEISNTSNHANMLLQYRDTGNETHGIYNDKFINCINIAKSKMNDVNHVASHLFEN